MIIDPLHQVSVLSNSTDQFGEVEEDSYITERLGSVRFGCCFLLLPGETAGKMEEKPGRLQPLQAFAQTDKRSGRLIMEAANEGAFIHLRFATCSSA